MRPVRVGALLAGAMLMAAAPAAAQISLELRPGVAVGAYEPTAAGLDFAPRASLHAQAGYPLRPAMELFLGGGFSSFGCTVDFCAGADPTFTRAGVDFGARLSARRFPLAPWGTAGVGLQSLHVSGGEWGPMAAGVTLGGGVTFPLSARLALTPGLNYAVFRAPESANDQGGIADVFALQLGIRLR